MRNGSPDGSPQTRWVAIYARTSTEDQAERQTVQGQLEFLRRFCSLYSHVQRYEIAAEYVDDGWSGTVPLGERPDGRRLLEDARAGRFQEVLVYRLDRLGRSLRALLDANAALEAAGVTIHSATEPFDTATPIGRFVFQLLGSLAELERSTITELMALGRDRNARAGKWTNGPIPIGYDLDQDGCLVPSARKVNGLDLTEAELVADLFRRIAEGSTTIVEARRFNTLGLSLTRRYGGGKEVLVSTTGVWPVSRINFIIRNPVYKGLHVFKSRGGPIEREVPALVSPELWQTANDRLKRNKSLALRNGTRKNLLRGLIRCADCGYMYAGSPSHSRNSSNWEGYYYRCSSQLGVVHPDPTKRCRAKMIPAAYLEQQVWQDCRNFILNPGEALAEAQRQLRERLEQAAGIEAERERLQELLAEKEAERERVMTLFRRGHISLSEAEVQLDVVGREMADLRALTDSLAAQVELAKAWEARVVEATVLLARLRERLADIEARDDWDAKRQVVETLVQEITVQTERDGKHKRGTITIRYVFGEPRHAVVANTNVPTVTRGYARAYHSYLDLHPATFETQPFVKTNMAELLRRELRRPTWRGEPIAIGTGTDPYQPLEEQYRLTRRCLLELAVVDNPGSITTKGTLVVRDVDVIAELARRTDFSVHTSLISLDAELLKRLEPGAPPPASRLRAIERLSAAGIPVSVFLMAWLSAEFPHLAPGYARLYGATMGAPLSYQLRIQTELDAARRSQGLHEPALEVATAAPRSRAAQLARPI